MLTTRLLGEGSAWSMRTHPPTDADLRSLLDRVQLPGENPLHSFQSCILLLTCTGHTDPPPPYCLMLQTWLTQ